MSEIAWSPQQEGAIKAAKEWLKEKNGAQVFRIFGYAGTGKTTLAKEIAEAVKNVLYGAFTGKAASVMRRKGCSHASTIHSMIYSIDEENANGQPTFVLNEESDVCDSDLVILDECSMIDETIGIFNGSLWEVDSMNPPKKKRRSKYVEPGIHLQLHSIDDDTRVKHKDVRVLQQFFHGTEKELDWMAKRGTQEFTYGYALTCHKSQGSQWNSVMVFDEAGAFGEDARRWRYTAVTRAAEKLTMVV
jgi:ATP-dependent exoDNAse (exonuclease V) alpha subunit